MQHLLSVLLGKELEALHGKMQDLQAAARVFGTDAAVCLLIECRISSGRRTSISKQLRQRTIFDPVCPTLLATPYLQEEAVKLQEKAEVCAGGVGLMAPASS